MTPSKLYFQNQKNQWRLWKLRDKQKREHTQEEFDAFCIATDENAEVRDFILERWGWF